jgi:formylglycine-generating enzyme required for sulfatase activity
MRTRLVALVPVATILLLDLAGAGLKPCATGLVGEAGLKPCATEGVGEAGLKPCATGLVGGAGLKPCATEGVGGAGREAGQAPAPFSETLGGTLVSFEMVPVPGGVLTLDGKEQDVPPVYNGRSQVTWDLYDVFALGLDRPAAGDADAQARPSEPYGAPDMGWGHAGYPAINVTRDAAEAFAAWLSKKTGRTYRLPTEAEWTRAAVLAAGPGGLDRARLDQVAWHAGNSGGRTHPAAGKARDALGLHDLFGNVAEWVTGTPARAVRGGSFRSDPNDAAFGARLLQEPSWNDRDPQLPKSKWWLPDAPFVGFRIVAEVAR